MFNDCLVEIDAQHRVVWKWHANDHLNPSVDIIGPMYRREEWCHSNSVARLRNGNILLSSRSLDSLLVIEKKRGRLSSVGAMLPTWIRGRGASNTAVNRPSWQGRTMLRKYQMDIPVPATYFAMIMVSISTHHALSKSILLRAKSSGSQNSQAWAGGVFPILWVAPSDYRTATP